MKQLLNGHDSPETAYLTFDYPFGRRIRCVQRHWIETAVKGAKNGEQRLVSQTTHKSHNIYYTARIAEVGQEAADSEFRALIETGQIHWNAAKGSTYSMMVVMFLSPLADDSGREGVQCDHLNEYSYPEDFRRFGQYQLDNDQRTRLAGLEVYSRRYNPRTWAEYDAKQSPLPPHPCPQCGKANHIVNECGCDPANVPTPIPAVTEGVRDGIRAEAEAATH